MKVTKTVSTQYFASNVSCNPYVLCVFRPPRTFFVFTDGHTTGRLLWE
jgi:hypothetical protein